MIRTRTTQLVALLFAVVASQTLVLLPASAQPAASKGFQTVALDQVDTPALVAVSPDSNWVWVVDENKQIVEVLDAHTRRTVGKWVKFFNATVPADVRSISVSVDDGWVAYLAMLNGVLRVDMHTSSVSGVTSAQSTTAAAATADNTLVRTTLANGADVVDTRSGATAALDVSPVTVRPARSSDGRTAYVVGLTPPTLFRVDVRSRGVDASWPIRVSGSGSTAKIAISPSGRFVVTTDYGIASILDTSTGISTPATGDAGHFLDVTFGPTDDVFYLADGADLVKVENGVVAGRFASPSTNLHSPAYDPGTATMFMGER